MIITKELSISEFEYQKYESASPEELQEFFLEKAEAAGYSRESSVRALPRLVDRDGEKLLLWSAEL